MTDQDENAELDDLIEQSSKETEEGQEVEESTVQTDEVVESEAAPEIPEELQPVSAWKEEARQAWASLAANQDYHDQLRNLRGQIDSDYQYRTQLEQERAELGQRAQVADQFNQLAQQYGDVFQGRNPLEVVGQYLYYGKQLSSNPQETLQQLAKEYGVDLNQVAQDQPYIDEHTQMLQSQLSQMQQQIQNQEAQRQQEQANRVLEQARAFEFETDAEGKPLHPHVADVANEMLGLMQAGYAQDFKTAYDKAIRMNDDVWSKIQSEQGKKQEQQRKEQAQKAKAAATAQPKPGKSSVTAPKGVEDIDDALEAAFAEQSA